MRLRMIYLEHKCFYQVGCIQHNHICIYASVGLLSIAFQVTILIVFTNWIVEIM